MTLLELLRQELPKRGGWPEGANECVQDCSGVVKFFDSDNLRFDGESWAGSPRGNYYCNQSDKIRGLTLSNDYATAIVTREQYGWDGTNLPPVGCECEFMKHTLDTIPNWRRGIIKYISEYTVVIIESLSPGEFVTHPRTCNFRPLRTEADKKRDAAIEAIDWYMPECILDTPNEFGHAKKIYDAIAAGKIPGVKLEV
jgi:hypothetical protein